MTETREATVYMAVTIPFEDDGEHGLKDLARDEILSQVPHGWSCIDIDRVYIESEDND